MSSQIPPFDGFGKRAITFWPALEQNNSKDYFTAHRQTYEDDIREPMERLLADVAEDYGDNSKVFRPNRDVRFSKDKSPYKLHCGAVIGEGSGAAEPSVLYVQVSAAGIFSASGCYRMSRDQRQRFYAAVDEESSGEELRQLVADAERAGLQVGGSTLKTAPRGYRVDHPRIALLRHTSLTVAREFAPADWIFTPAAAHRITEVWREATPLNTWLHRNVGAAQEEDR